MHLIMESRALIILLVFLQLSVSSSLPARSKRHVDGMFTSEFSRARGSAAIRKIINSALAGKRDVEENYQIDTPDVDYQKKILNELVYNSLPELRSEERQLTEQEAAEDLLCSAILYMLYRPPYQPLPAHSAQDYQEKNTSVGEEKHI
uniref:Glucagon / GIP / secretin / VIP family domain-containing protein n=1 Tax=Xenopus tropicalis TaxID=8364 RepID=A0A6I8SB73_XENTR